MLSYRRHSFHAGNRERRQTHTVQELIIESLKRKPFLSIWTRARGRYRIGQLEHAERTGNYLEGIARVSGSRTTCPPTGDVY